MGVDTSRAPARCALRALQTSEPPATGQGADVAVLATDRVAFWYRPDFVILGVPTHRLA
jgi:hypothetical protein